MKQRSKGILFLWLVIASAVAGGTFLFCEHLGIGTMPDVAIAPAAQPDMNSRPDADADMDTAQDNSITSTATSTAIAMQNFSNDGYTFSVPASWNIERTASDTIAIHASTSSPDAGCKLEVSAFPFAAGTDVAGWIGDRIGADPSISVVEQSSENVSVSGGTGVKWIGTIDGQPTTLVYLFGESHAYEIAPSFVGANDAASAAAGAQCDDMLDAFLPTIKI